MVESANKPGGRSSWDVYVDRLLAQEEELEELLNSIELGDWSIHQALCHIKDQLQQIDEQLRECGYRDSGD